MKKYLLKFKSVIFLLVFVFFLFSYKNALAYIPGESCATTADCETVSGYKTFCTNNVCAYVPLNSSYYKFQESIDTCYDSGEMNLDCYYAGTQSKNVKNGQSGVIDSLINTGVYIMQGDTGNQDDTVGSSTNGAIPFIAGLINKIYLNPPASSIEYFAYEFNKFNLVKPAFAQQRNAASSSLKQILPIWKSFRDVAYVFYVIIFVVVGLAIMLRIKLDPKTAITIQNAIPKFVISLILITFSYAIAGLMIDLIYVVSALGVAIIKPNGTDFIEVAIDTAGNTGITGGRDNPNFLVFALYYIGKGYDYAATMSRVLNPVTLIQEYAGVPQSLIKVSQAITNFTILGIQSSLITLILTIIIFITFFKIFFSLLKAYVQIILSIILAPLQIMFNAIPGQRSFGNWIRNLVANLAVFPTIILLLALTSRITSSVESSPGGFWVPPIIRPPVANIIPASFITAMIGYGILLLIPKIADMVRDALKVPAFKYGSAIGEAIKPVTGPIKFLGGAVSGGVKSGIGTMISKNMAQLPKGPEEISANVTPAPSENNPEGLRQRLTRASEDTPAAVAQNPTANS